MGPRPRSPRIRTLLRRLAFFLKYRSAAKGFEFYIAGAVFWLVGAVGADLLLELSTGARAKMLAFFAVGSVVWIAGAVVVPFFRRVNPMYVAQLVEERCPECDAALITLVEESDLDDGVADLLEEAVEPRISGLRPRDCAPPHELGAAHRLLTGVTIVGVAMALASGRGFANSLVRVLYPGSRGLGVAAPEVVVEIPKDVTMREGEPVLVSCRTLNFAAASARARFRPDGEGGAPLEAPLIREPGRKWRGSFGPVSEPGSYEIVAESRREEVGEVVSRRYRVEVRRYPRLALTRVTYRSPRYTGEAERTVRGTRIDCLEGTRVRVEFTPSVEVGRASVELVPGGRVKLAEGEGGTRSFEFDAQVSGVWVAKLVSVDGLERSVGPFPVVVRTDAPPEAVALAEPPARGRVAEGGLPVSVRASDDFGLAKVELLLSRAGRPGEPLGVPGIAGRRSFFARMVIPAAAFTGADGEATGGSFTYRLRVTDNRLPTPNVTLSKERSLDLLASERQRSLLDRPDRRLRRKRDGSGTGEPNEVEMAEGPGPPQDPGRTVERLDDGAPTEEPPRRDGTGKPDDYSGLPGEGPEAPPPAGGEKEPGREGEGGDPAERRPTEEGGAEPGEGGPGEEKHGEGEPKEAPPPSGEGGDGGGELPPPPGGGGMGEGPRQKAGREKIGHRGPAAEVRETVDEKRVNELEFADDEVARLAGEGVGVETGHGRRGDGAGGGTETSAGGEGGDDSQAARLSGITEGVIDSKAPTGATAAELSRTVEPEYRPLVEEYYRRLTGGK